MEKKNLEVEVYLADDTNQEFFKVYKIYEIPDNPSEEPIFIQTYLSYEQAKKVAKQLENDNGITTLIGIDLVWLS